jgi:hypothetical protein
MIVAASALDLGVAYDVWCCADQRIGALMLDYFGIPQTTWIPLGVLGLGLPGRKSREASLTRSLNSLFYEEVWGVEADYEEKYRQLKGGV